MTSRTRLFATRIAFVAASLAAIAVPATFASSRASAQDEPIFAPGQPIVTGFSGVVEPDAPPAGSDPLDYTFIDLDGASARIMELQPDAPPSGELIDSPSVFSATAADVGQVFGVALDNAPELVGAEAPNVYLAAASAFGLHLVVPDADGNPVRSKVGGAGASFMPGQWGSAGGAVGYPGSIWKIDGTTGEISLFTTIAANTGPGLADLVYDPSSTQFFVSDLDTGLIYRLAADGIILDTFDHGVDGRPAHELEPIEDDGSALDVTDPAFNSEDPATWGFTQPERRVRGLEAYNGRLYYAIAGQIWSVRIEQDGSFGAARWELDVVDLLSNNEIASILFDPQGRMILAQRGPQVGSYDYSAFAESGTSSVVRYKREFPDDPETPGTWVETPDSYAIGNAPDGAQASGGIALGPDYNEETGALQGACDAYLWATGDALRDNGNVDDPLEPPLNVHGLQGTPASLVRPANDPPILSFFADYDGIIEDDETEALKQGHVGAVAFWQECASGAATYVPPPFFPAGEEAIFEEEDDDEVADDEEGEDEAFANLTLEKWASPFACAYVGAEWWCTFTIRVENTGDEPYWGPVVVDDYLPAGNPGASLDFWPEPPWSCGPTGPTSAQCVRGPVLLFPGDGVVLHEVVKLPKALVDYCHLVNVAELNWFWGDDDDPSDDFDGGVAGIPGPGCGLPAGTTDLLLDKVEQPICVDGGVDWKCSYLVSVHNVGPGNFSGPITITDTLGVNAPATVVGPWTCAQAGPVLTCNINVPPVNAPPGWSSAFIVTASVPKAAPPLCDLENEANISAPAAGSPMNQVAGNDFESVIDHIPDPACLVPQPDTDFEMKKTATGCAPFVYLGTPGYVCGWQMQITNVGTDPFTGDLTFVDSTAGATKNWLKVLFPGACTGPENQVTCSFPGAGPFNPGVPATVPFHTFYPDGPDACSATNNLSILQPNPGSPQNPAGNDSDTAAQALPNPACAGLPRINIQKTATGCYDDPASEFWLCDFDISVFSYGAVAQPGPIDVHDFNDKPTTFTGAACIPAGPGAWKCTHPGPLAPLSAWSFQAQTQVDPNGVTLADCEVLNSVWITNPLNADPGHFAQATQKVPQLFINVGPGPVYVYCDPPSLKLTKTHVKTVKSGDGYDATFTVRATSTGPDPYIGTVEVDEDLPDGTSFVSSENWSCVPTLGNDVHCSSTFKTIPVGKYTQMTITIHIPTDVAIAVQCNVVNTVHAAISAEVLHSDEGVQYTASAAADLPARLCREPEEPRQCPVERVMPGGDCCAEGTTWNGRQCAKPRPECPRDSHINNAGKCVCDAGTEGEPGKCKPIQSQPVCPRDSHINNAGKCVCDRGTEGTPGKCRPIEEEEDEPICPRDSRLVRGDCQCLPGTEGRPGRCRPIEDEEKTCPRDSRLNRAGECVCNRGTEGTPGNCRPIVEEPICPKDSRLVRGECRCLPGTEGRPGNCRPIEQEKEEDIRIQSCPDDSHFDTRRNRCICNQPLQGEPGKCTGIILEFDQPVLRLPSIN
jgi:hypothetical protein